VVKGVEVVVFGWAKVDEGLHVAVDEMQKRVLPGEHPLEVRPGV
jgi:hypothetical protein